MEFSDVAQVQEIARRSNLSNWSDKDYKREVEKKHSVTKVGKLKERTIAFMVARLIIYENSNAKFHEITNNKEEYETGNYETGNFDSKQIDVDIEIYNIGVVEQMQGRGIGAKLLEILYEAGTKYKSAKIWLEVRESNTKAINFYRANNFEICYRRKNFYAKPTENGLVLKLEINQHRRNKE
jgi:ribosomal protein S18 acetylase RimI-like enzyme